MSRIGLSQLPRKTQEYVRDRYGVTVAAPPYRRCFDAAVQNLIPASFANGRWGTEDTPENIDAVARGLGMIPAGARPVDVREPVAA